jgi:hypothetical protein
MAAIDFPASPTSGQLFSAANGVTYMYNGTIWIVQAGPGGGTGDFWAYNSAFATINNVTTVQIFDTVGAGNSGGYYNVTNGRWTPPAGRYSVFSSLSGETSTSSGIVNLFLRKNGTAITNASSFASTSQYGFATVEAIVNANGTDYFESAANMGVAGFANAAAYGFGAFPLTGMQGPPGDPGTPLAQNAQTGNYTLVLGDANGHLYHAVAAAAATYTIPANASVAYPIGTTLSFVNDSVNNVTIAITTDTLVLSPGTTTGSRTLATGGVATALKVTTTRWVINGTGLT